MQYFDGIAAGIALVGLLYTVVSYVRKRGRDDLIMAAVCATAFTVATVSAFAPHAAGLVLSPLIWAAVVAAVFVIRKERRERGRQH